MAKTETKTETLAEAKKVSKPRAKRASQKLITLDFERTFYNDRDTRMAMMYVCKGDSGVFNDTVAACPRQAQVVADALNKLGREKPYDFAKEWKPIATHDDYLLLCSKAITGSERIYFKITLH